MFKVWVIPVAAALTIAGPAMADQSCGETGTPINNSVRAVFAQSSDPTIKAWTGYMNDRFYADLACLASRNGVNVENLSAGELLAELDSGASPRNQSDALLIVLSAMEASQHNKLSK
ncbi:hypothetical protein [Nitratireductor sp. XY-223]|uniref:hypothetical protein n=1 Tax=Nitratireductor sp. XY-223 TaxID=2561926 RepID=UPI0010AAF833|nr:hypothetical protein [Nitratireductor sp. XY-223]